METSPVHRSSHLKMTATEVRRLIDADEETLERYVSSLLERYQERDRDIKAWAHIEPDRVLRQARLLDRIPRERRGPLHGFVIGVKDAILTEGVYAFKPTWNAISPEGQKMSSLTLDTFAVMARSIADLQQVGKVLGLRDDEPPRQIPLTEATFAFVKSPIWPSAGPGTVAALQRAAKILRKAGAHVVEVTLPHEFDDIISLQNEILEAEIGVAFHREYSTSRNQISHYLASIAQTAHTGSKKAYVRALDKIAALRPKMDEIADRYTAIVTPSAIDVAPKGARTGSSDFNAMWTALHMPVINVPGFKGEDDMPVGLSLVTSRFRDEHLLQVARQVGGLFAAKGGDI
ncbi:Glutamyl-tRNA(Gln) amidotransferase subunit A [Colletotrichum sp. SAR 10_65]|nr:Glutamyl-tRNA(Gln) amidotransferase subunit A [Colletotrichum sp. SAR 10_65]KAI8258915.1 Glutamyl-tRNA(Gln) amidotransferase subunit A [Colletotrichum sp. SAR 10_77]